MLVLHIQSQYLEKNTKFSNFSKLSKIHIFPVFCDSTQPSKTICKITNTWNMSPIIKLNIIEYLFLLYINKQLQKKSIKKRNLAFYFCRANRPPLGSWRYVKTLGSLKVKMPYFCPFTLENIWEMKKTVRPTLSKSAIFFLIVLILACVFFAKVWQWSSTNLRRIAEW